METLLYYKTQRFLNPGDNINPGQWGNIIFGIGPAHNRYYAECLIEFIRQNEFPDLPSRLKAAFAFEDLEYAQTWNRGLEEILYEVRLIDKPKFRGDMAWIDFMNECKSFECTIEAIRRYWHGDRKDGNGWEVLSLQGFSVVRRITQLPEDDFLKQ